jgi:energy-coupling factor transporter ATP-binding protein EcfA2
MGVVMGRRERLLDQGSADPLVRFAMDLRSLRQQAGDPTYRALARRAGLSISTLAAAASGRGLPTLAATRAYVQACGGDVQSWEQRWHGLAPARTTAVENAAEDVDSRVDCGPESPYLGLAVFEPGDADRFFGRAEAIEELVTRVTDSRFVIVFGASGSGKSSLLRAGLVARWAGDGGRFLVVTPGQRPLLTYQAALAALPEGAGAAKDELLVVVDQFEEVFTACADEAERRQFIALLLETAHLADGHVRVVLGVRTDFYSHCAHDPDLAQELQHSQFLCRPMTAEQLRAVITRPATQTGAMVENALLTQILIECAGQPGVLPLLSHALRETWQRRSGATMTLSGYRAAGRIAHAIAQTAEQVFRGFDESDQRLAKTLFLRLVALGDGTEDTKRRVTTAELDLEHPRMAATLARLTAARLVTVDHDHVEITHEALIRHWPRLGEWLSEDRDGLRVQRQLTAATAIWESLDRDPATLYRGVQLALAHQLAASENGLLTGQEREFLARSSDTEDQFRMRERRRTRRLRVLVVLLCVLVVAAGGLAAVTTTSVRTLTKQRDQIEAQDLLDRVATEIPTDRVLTASMSVIAYRLFPEPQTSSAVLNYPIIPAAEWSGGNSEISPAFSSDGRTVAIADTPPTPAGTAFWNISGGPAAQFVLNGLSGTVVGQAVVFASHGHLLATTSEPGMLWDDSDMSRLRRVATVPDLPLAFSSNGRLLAGTQSVWDLTRPPGHGGS